MTDKKISQLDAAAALDGTELVELVQSGANKRTTAQAIADLAGSTVPNVEVYKFLYSFAVDGGAVGSVVMRGTALPTDFIFRTAFIDVTSVFGSAGVALAALSIAELPLQLVNATSPGSSPWSSLGIHECQPSTVKFTAPRIPELAISGAALNAGVFNLYVQGVQS